jgi:CheY-like chemotaxis protein
VSQAASSALRILVADDERDTVETLRLVLQDEGHEVHAVHRGPEVLRAVLDLDPDAVLLDIGLPELSGHEVARKIPAATSGRCSSASAAATSAAPTRPSPT